MLRPLPGGALLAAGLLAAVHAGAAAAADFHQTFEARCAACHGHAGDFARARLTVGDDGVVRGTTSGREIAPFLRSHAGGLSAEETELFLEAFRRQIGSGAFFRERCGICHDRAYDFARLRLIVRDGRLVGRYSGRDIGAFLTGHARMTDAEAARMLASLIALREGR